MIRRWFKQLRWEMVGLGVLAWVIFMNLFPAGHIILGADILQPINMAERLSEFHADWSGRVTLYYSLFYLLDRIGISDTAQISWYLGVFLVGSYVSFLGFGQLLFPHLSRLVRILCALFYALNPFTLYLFTATWGYSHYPILYIFLPALTSLFLRALSERAKYQMLLFFFLVVALASGSFGNPAFALALGIYFLCLFLFAALLHLVPCDRATFARLVSIGIGALLLNAYWLLPLLPQLRAGIESVYTSEFVDLTERLRKTSNAIFDTLRLLPTSEQNRYYPYNFPYVSLAWMKQAAVYATFLPFLFTFFGWWFLRKQKEERSYFLLFAMLLMIWVALVARVRFPFDTVNAVLFQWPGMNTLRGWDKFALFSPILVSALLLLSLSSLRMGRLKTMTISLFIGTLVLVGLPYYGGGLQTKLSYILSSQKAKNYELAKQSALVKVPRAYEEIAPLLSHDSSEQKIAMLPYSPGSSVGRVNLPVWKVNGPHPAHALYRQPFLEVYDTYLPGWQFGKEYTTGDPRFVTHLLGLLGVKYVLYERDATRESQEEFGEALAFLESTGELVRLMDTDIITLYALSSERLFPLIYTASLVPTLDLNRESVSLGAEALHQSMRALSYDRLSSQSIRVPFSGQEQSGQTLFLNERFDPLWQAIALTPEGSTEVLSRDMSIRYANAWHLPVEMKAGTVVTVSYLPERYLWYGMWLSGSVFLILALGFLAEWRREKNSKREQL